MALRFEAACGCHMGHVRKNNEDNFVFDGKCLPENNEGLEAPLTLEQSLRGRCCLAVLDGMGGESSGECASFSAAELLRKSRRGMFGSDEVWLDGLCKRMNLAVLQRAKELEVSRMGTTLAMLCFSSNNVYVCNLGDSRIYRLRGSRFKLLSVDHTVPYFQGKKAPLTQYLGIDPEEYLIEPTINRETILKGDQYLLCSDGLTDMLSEKEIARTLERESSAELAVRALIRAALDAGGRDNVTAIVCRIA